MHVVVILVTFIVPNGSARCAQRDDLISLHLGINIMVVSTIRDIVANLAELVTVSC